MKPKQTFIRVLFSILSVALFTTFFTSSSFGGITFFNLILGLMLGFGFAAFLWMISTYLLRISLKTLNTVSLGLFFGAVFGFALSFVFTEALKLTTSVIPTAVSHFISGTIYLTSLFLGVYLAVQQEEEIHLSIPFIRLEPKKQKKKDILLDLSILQDARIIDLASSGLLDQSAIIPRYIVKDLQEIAEEGEEVYRNKARRTLEVINRLEAMPGLKIRYTDADFGEKEETTKIIRLARMIDCDLLTADISRIEQSSVEGVRIINIHSLANALKPLTQSGETLTIKVQRYGKEPRQGVGYLDDGTMVVINGGADFIGETIKTHVLSVKHTSSGRMIFCNAADEIDGMHEEDYHARHAHKTPYTV